MLAFFNHIRARRWYFRGKKDKCNCRGFNAQIAPHLYAGPIEWAANIQLATNIPNILMAETILTGGEFHLKLINNSIKWENGFILTPTNQD